MRSTDQNTIGSIEMDSLVVSGRSPRVNPFKKGNFIKVTIHHLHKLEGVQTFTLSM